MSAIVTCACGQSFRASARLLGKTVACPKCRQPLTIPAAEEPLEELASVAETPYNAFGGGDPFASAPGAVAAAWDTPAAVPARPAEEAPDMRLVMFSSLAAGGVLLTLILAIAVHRMVNRRADPAVASAAPAKPTPVASQPAAPSVAPPTTPPAAAPTNSAPSQVTPATAPAAPAPGWSMFGSSGKRSVIYDRFEATGPVALVPRTPPNPIVVALAHGALKDFAGRIKAEFVVTVVPNAGNVMTLDKAQQEMAARNPFPGCTLEFSRITVNDREALLMIAKGPGKRARSITQLFPESGLTALVLVGTDADYPDAEMDRFLQTFKLIK